MKKLVARSGRSQLTSVKHQLSAAEARQIDQVCDQFESAWKSNSKPSISEYVTDQKSAARSELLRQLIVLDWEYRHRCEHDFDWSYYYGQFPIDHDIIDHAVNELKSHDHSTFINAADDSELFQSNSMHNQPNVAQTLSGWNRYAVGKEAGNGGIGIIFRGHDQLLNRPVAIKVLRSDYCQNAEARHRFFEEARVCSRLQHPAIVPVYDTAGMDEPRPFFAMKLVEGHTLSTLLKKRKDCHEDLPGFFEIFKQVCQAVAYAHSQGIVHRDLKPSNIMVGEFGEVQVMDWGFAKQIGEAEDEAQKPEEGAQWTKQNERVAVGPTRNGRHNKNSIDTLSGAMMGTPAYMSPEQARGEVGLIDARTDVFALGAILCEILTANPPYRSSAVDDDICMRAVVGNLQDAHDRLDASSADSSLRELCRHCLSRDRADRPNDASALLHKVTEYLASAQDKLKRALIDRAAADARAEQAAAKAKAEQRARRMTVALGVGAVGVMILAGSGWYWRQSIQQIQALQTATIDSKVEVALIETTDYSNRSDWARAAAAVTRARELLESGASDHWREHVEAARLDVQLLTNIDEIFLLQTNIEPPDWNSFDCAKKSLPRFPQVFERYGIVVGSDVNQVTARIVARPGSVREGILAGLENWWWLATCNNFPERAWLELVVQAIDPDPWRTNLRQVIAAKDHQALEALAAQAEAARQPRATLQLIAAELTDHKALDAVVSLLRPAQARYADDFWINFYLGQALAVRKPVQAAEALRFLSIAAVLRPAGAAHYNILVLASSLNDWDGTIFAARKVIELRPGYVFAYQKLAKALEKKGDVKQAEATYQKALDFEPAPEAFETHFGLGMVHYRHSQYDRAIAAFRRAIQLSPNNAEAHFNLGQAHFKRDEFSAALAAYDKAIELDAEYASPYLNRGNTLTRLKRLDDAIAAYETYIRLVPTDDKGYGNLGVFLLDKRRPDLAVPAFTRAAELNGKFANHYYFLGLALRDVGNLDAADVAYRKAIAVNSNHSGAHWNLGADLAGKGRFSEALVLMEQGQRLGAKPQGAATDNELGRVRRCIALEANLPAVIDGSLKPASHAEQLDYAYVCQAKGLNLASAQLYAGVLSGDNPPAKRRYDASCVAALAGCGEGSDAPTLASERTQWRIQALAWLRIELEFWKKSNGNSREEQIAAQKAFSQWRKDQALSGIRELDRLAKLPERERADWLKFWADVDSAWVNSVALQTGKN